MTSSNEIISRVEAKKRGFKHYFTGVPCSENGVGLRYTSNGRCLCEKCLVKIKAQKVADNSKHLKKRNETKKKWAQNNPEKVKSSQKASDLKRQKTKVSKPRKTKVSKPRKTKLEGSYWERNKEKIRAKRLLPDFRERYLISKHKYKLNHKEKIRAESSKRRACRKQSVPVWFGEFDQFVFEEAYDLAAQRQVETGIEWHVDHMIPLRAKKVSGLHCAANVQVIPAVMNLQKNNKMMLTEPNDWLK